MLIARAAVLAAALLATLPALAQDAERRSPDDVIQLKDGSLLVGKIVRVTDVGVEMALKNGGRVSPTFKELVPYSAYRVKADRIDPSSAAQHFELGEFCLANGWWMYAVIEFDKAAALDRSFAERARVNREKAFNEDARTRFEEARRLIAERKYDDAEKILTLLVTSFKDTPWAKEAQSEMAKVNEEIRKKNEDKRRQIDEKQRAKVEAAGRAKEDAEKSALAQARELIDDAKKQWTEGLDWEGKSNLTKADRAWKLAEARLANARRHSDTLAKSNDASVVKQVKEVEAEVDAWLLKTCYRLGRMWAVELNYPEAMLWLNKGLRISPDDHLINEVLLTLSQLQMRKRAAGGGY